MGKMKHMEIKLWAAVLALCGLAAFLWWQNNALQVTRMVIEAPVKEGVRIVHLSDLHGKFFGLRQEQIARVVRAQQPDVIVMTGDYFDSSSDERAAVLLIEAISDIAPVYCVTGNHEWIDERAGRDCYDKLLTAIEQSDVRLLQGETVWLTDEISLTGAEDVPFAGGIKAYPEYLDGLYEASEGSYRLLLAHRPEFFEEYASAGFDLTLSGHAHGGQIRLPFVGALYAPGQEWWPRYTGGLYQLENGMKIVVNRGLGNSTFPIRLFNRPEVGVIELVAENGPE